MTAVTGAQALVGQLQTEGVDTVFGLPGDQIMAAFDALYQVRDRIRLIQTLHEQAAAYMAFGYAKAAGKAGVALVVPGPGALNASAGLGTAYAASAPVLLISGQVPAPSLGKGLGLLHEVDDQLQVFEPITKWNRRIVDVREIPETVHEALRQLKSGRPRPVELEIPPDILSSRARVEFLPPEEFSPPPPDPSQIREAARSIGEARNPLILAGGGVLTAGASGELLELADFLQAPVTTTAEGKGAVSEAHPLWAGVHYGWVAPEALVDQSDLILAVGTRLTLRTLKPGASHRVIHIDVDPVDPGDARSSRITVRADARAALALLRAELSRIADPRPAGLEAIARHRNSFQEKVRSLAPLQTDLIGRLRRVLNEDAVVVPGINNIGMWSHLIFPVHPPGIHITPSYFGTLGFAFPTALGAQAACPERQVLAICGDGGFLFGPQELATAMKYRLPVVVLLLNNEAYGSSKWQQTHQYEGRYLGTDLRNPDFVKLAEAFGVRARRSSIQDLEGALEEALAARTTCLLEVRLPQDLRPPVFPVF